MHPQLLDLEGLAVLTATSASTARRWASNGTVPGTLVGGSWRFWAPAVLDAVAGPHAAAYGPPTPDDFTEPGVVGAPELADLLGIHERTITLLLRTQAVPGRRVAHSWRASWPAIRDAIAAGRDLASLATASTTGAGDASIDVTGPGRAAAIDVAGTDSASSSSTSTKPRRADGPGGST